MMEPFLAPSQVGTCSCWSGLRSQQSMFPKGLARSVRKQTLAISRCEHAYRGDRPALALTGHAVILVDDGFAAIHTLIAAVAALRASMPARVIVALPVTAASTFGQLLGFAEMWCAWS